MKDFLAGILLAGMLIFSQNTANAASQNVTATQVQQKDSTEKVKIVPTDASYSVAFILTLDMSGM